MATVWVGGKNALPKGVFVRKIQTLLYLGFKNLRFFKLLIFSKS